MTRRLLIAVLAGAAAISLTPAATSASVPAVARAAAPTSVTQIRPVDSNGREVSGYTIAHQRKHARCIAGSEATGSAYRCFSGNVVLDPCWAQKPARFAVCLSEPWGFRLVQLKVTKGYHGKLSKHRSQPWGLQLTNGVQCEFAQGASGAVAGKRINYFCAHSKTVLYGNVDKHSKVWRIRSARSRSGGHFTKTGRLALTRAWFGKPSRKG
jgi:hypothetical protein